MALARRERLRCISQWTLLGTGFALALGFAVFQALFPFGELGALVLNGLTVAVYGLLMSLARFDRQGAIYGAVLFGLGLSHFVWVSCLVFVIFLLNMPFGMEWLFALHGLVFGYVVWRTERAASTIIVMATAVALSIGVSLAQVKSNLVTDIVATSALPLHLGIATTLLVRGLKAIHTQTAVRNNLCIHCDYPIGDLSKLCPECGKTVRA